MMTPKDISPDAPARVNRDRQPAGREAAAAHSKLLAESELTEGEWEALHVLAMLFEKFPDIVRIIRLLADRLEAGGDGR